MNDNFISEITIFEITIFEITIFEITIFDIIIFKTGKIDNFVNKNLILALTV